VSVSLKYFAERKSATQLTYRLLHPALPQPISDEAFHHRSMAQLSFAAFVSLALMFIALVIFR
jgi:hypothetical protein